MGLFWNKPEEEVKQPVKATVKAPSSIKSTEFVNSIETSHINTTVPGVRKQEIVDYFGKVFSDNNIPGPDYQEFSIALGKMKNVAQDEATKIKTIFIGFEAMGLTPAKLIETANVYKKLYADKLAQFDAELNAAFNSSVGTKETTVNELAEKNKKIDDDMRKLNDMKLANEQTAKALIEEIQQNTSDLNIKKNDWHATYDDVIKEIDANVELINTHLVNQ